MPSGPNAVTIASLSLVGANLIEIAVLVIFALFIAVTEFG